MYISATFHTLPATPRYKLHTLDPSHHTPVFRPTVTIRLSKKDGKLSHHVEDTCKSDKWPDCDNNQLNEWITPRNTNRSWHLAYGYDVSCRKEPFSAFVAVYGPFIPAIGVSASQPISLSTYVSLFFSLFDRVIICISKNILKTTNLASMNWHISNTIIFKSKCKYSSRLNRSLRRNSSLR